MIAPRNRHRVRRLAHDTPHDRNAATVAAPHSRHRRLTRLPRAGGLIAGAVCALGLACTRREDGRTLPMPNGKLAAVLVVHADDCDGNFNTFRVFERPDVARAAPLVGVVPLDDSTDVARLRGSLRAFDVDAPVVPVNPRLRALLSALAHGEGMTVVFYDRRHIAAVVRPPHDYQELTSWTARIRSFADSSAGTLP